MIDENILYMNGYEDCVVGYVERFGQPVIACYDRRKVLDRLEQDGMNPEEAEEFYQFNQLGAWMGEHTPCFLIQ